MLLKKIVVAEDDDAIAHLINMALGDAGFLCLRARNGQEAINLVRMHVPDLLVLDVMMPKVDGHEVARRIKSDVILSRTPILMLTALSEVDAKVQGFEAGADDYLVKPFDLRELGARVKALIRASRRERERNPTTQLPGSGAVEDRLEQVLGGDEGDAAVLKFDLRGFGRFADAAGYNRAQSLVASLGSLILECARRSCRDDGFVGHLGGVDFIAVVHPDEAESLAEGVIAGFEQNRDAWLAASAREAGETSAAVPGSSVEAPAAPPEPEPPVRRKEDRLAMAIAVVATRGLVPAEGAAGDSGRGAGDAAAAIDVLAQRIAAAMRSSKQRDGSNYVVWTEPKS